MEIMLSYNTNIYGYFYFLKGLSLAIVYVKVLNCVAYCKYPLLYFIMERNYETC